jgi:hypothetical protein
VVRENLGENHSTVLNCREFRRFKASFMAENKTVKMLKTGMHHAFFLKGLPLE